MWTEIDVQDCNKMSPAPAGVPGARIGPAQKCSCEMWCGECSRVLNSWNLGLHVLTVLEQG